jgi:hypothetical protein
MVVMLLLVLVVLLIFREHDADTTLLVVRGEGRKR